MECRIDDELARYIYNQKQMGSIAARPEPFMDYFSVTQRNKGYKFEILKIEPDGDEKVHAKIKLTGNGFGKNFEEAGSMIIYDVFRIRGNGIVQIFPDYDAKAEDNEERFIVQEQSANSPHSIAKKDEMLQLKAKEYVDSMLLYTARMLCTVQSNDVCIAQKENALKFFKKGSFFFLEESKRMDTESYFDFLIAESKKYSSVTLFATGYWDFNCSPLRQVNDNIWSCTVGYDTWLRCVQTFANDYTTKEFKTHNEVLCHIIFEKNIFGSEYIIKIAEVRKDGHDFKEK